MKFFYFILSSLLLSSLGAFSQVGINIEDPTTMLDVNGNLRVRTLDSIPVRTNKVLVADANGQVYYDPNIIKNSFVIGSGNGNLSLLSITGLTGWNKIGFNTVTLDDNSEFNTTTSEFVAKKAGVYAVYVQFRSSSIISISTLGIGVLLRKGTAAPVVVAEDTYGALVGLLTVNSRKIFTIVKLDAGDALSFGVSNLNVTIAGGNSSYFTIFQVK